MELLVPTFGGRVGFAMPPPSRIIPTVRSTYVARDPPENGTCQILIQNAARDPPEDSPCRNRTTTPARERLHVTSFLALFSGGCARGFCVVCAGEVLPEDAADCSKTVQAVWQGLLLAVGDCSHDAPGQNAEVLGLGGCWGLAILGEGSA